jgi:hypothetical protein
LRDAKSGRSGTHQHENDSAREAGPLTLVGMVEQRITTVDQLVGLIGVPLPRVADKVRRSLHELDREWLAASPFCLVATSDDTGACDVSPKGDPPGHLA